LEASSFETKLINADYDRTTERENAEFFFIKGLAMKATRKSGFEAGVEYFSRAAYEDSTFPDPHYQIALYHLRCTGEREKIIEHINKGLAYDPDNGELLRTCGMYFLNYNENDSTRVYLVRAAQYLGPNDSRIPFYMGLTFDPYWKMIRPLGEGTDQFIKREGQRPAFPEIQQYKKEFLLQIPKVEDNINTAFSFFESTRSLHPGDIKPLNSSVWIPTNDILRGVSTFEQNPAKNRQQLEQFVGYGLVDPRSSDILSYGCAALRDCKAAREYLEMSKEATETIRLSPRYGRDLNLVNQNVAIPCQSFANASGHLLLHSMYEFGCTYVSSNKHCLEKRLFGVDKCASFRIFVNVGYYETNPGDRVFAG